jgi:predicted aminopeptidase
LSQCATTLRTTLLCVALLPALGGCYLLQAGAGQAEVIARSRPLEQALADPALDERGRQKLALVQEVRAFAIAELALPDGKSFRRYADLERRYALWNVVATPEFSVEPRQWCFPVAGCVAYRGYFEQPAAERFALRRRVEHGDDASVGGVATYSTLGHFADPVLNTMLGWSDARLAGTVIHELAHERLYVPGETAFNEAFAVVVEQAGLRRWLQAKGRDTELATVELGRHREAQFAALLREARSNLARLYSSERPVAELRVEKQREFGRLKHRYRTGLREQWGGYPGYDAWFARTLDNSHLAAVATYQDCVAPLARELEFAGSFAAFYSRMEALDETARAALCAAGPEGGSVRVGSGDSP